MKRKGGRGRKGKPTDSTENGNEDKVNENGESSIEAVEEPEGKKRKSNSSSNKRKNLSFTPKSSSSESEDDLPEYEVQKVLDEKMIKGVRHFLIRWKGYEPESDTWEPESTLSCPEIIEEFKKKKKSDKSKKIKTAVTEEENWDENENFEVERIIEVYHKKNGGKEFLVSWKGYPQSYNSWEPEENMDCHDLIAKFLKKVEQAKETDQRELRVYRATTERFTLAQITHGRRLSKRNVGKQRVQYHGAE